MAMKVLTTPSDDPAHAKLLAKRVEVLTGRDAAKAKRDALLGKSATGRSQPAYKTAALRLLGEEQAAAPIESYESACQDVLAHEQAIEMLDRQIADSHAALSRRIAEGRKPEYRAIVKRMSAALTALKEVAVEEYRFRDKAFQDDVSLSGVIRPMVFVTALLRNSDDLTRRIDAWHSEAKEYGLL